MEYCRSQIEKHEAKREKEKAKAERLRKRRVKLFALAYLPDLPEPRTLTITEPQVVRGFGKLWIVLGKDETSGRTVTTSYGRVARVNATVPLHWEESKEAAEKWVVDRFGERRTHRIFSGDNRKAQFPIYVPSDRTKNTKANIAYYEQHLPA